MDINVNPDRKRFRYSGGDTTIMYGIMTEELVIREMRTCF